MVALLTVPVVTAEFAILQRESVDVRRDGSAPIAAYPATRASTETSARRSATARTPTDAITLPDGATANPAGAEPAARRPACRVSMAMVARRDALVRKPSRAIT